MATLTPEKLLKIQAIAHKDTAFQRLSQEYDLLDSRLQLALKTMDEQQQNAVTDYIGLLIEMHMKLLEIACR